MAYSSPVLLKRIPADPAQRILFRYADYVASGGYGAYRKALGMAPGDLVKIVQDSGLRGRGGRDFRVG
jgi:NADH-quinone oxidoreductase subunit F